jgi:protein phosphatase
MGGHKAGEIASKMALDNLTGFLRENPGRLLEDPTRVLSQAFQQANKAIFAYGREHGEQFRGMGTTLTAALLRGNKLYIAHVGDSRAYLVCGTEIRLLTVDHSLVSELVKNGGITAQEAETHPQRNVLTRAIGTYPSVEVDVCVESINRGDLLILCTDGLSNLVNLEEIKQVAGENEPLVERARHFVDRALERGGADNITVVLYQME